MMITVGSHNEKSISLQLKAHESLQFLFPLTKTTETLSLPLVILETEITFGYCPYLIMFSNAVIIPALRFLVVCTFDPFCIKAPIWQCHACIIGQKDLRGESQSKREVGACILCHV